MARSLWLVPPPALHDRLAATIAILASRYGTAAFEPHVTLLGGLAGPEETLLSGARVLAERLRPFEVRLREASAGVDFFRCVFVTVDETPELLRAHALAREALGTATAEAFRPHLSLVYGRLGAEEKEAARQAAGELRSCFSADALHVVDTNGDVPGWRRLASYRFGAA